jgi:hypothetical protein
LYAEKYPEKYAGKYRQKYPEFSVHLHEHVYLQLDSDLYLDLNLDLDLNLNLFFFLKSFQQLFRKFFTSLFGLLFDLKYQQLWLSLYLVLCRQTLLRGRSPGRPLHGGIVSRADRRYYIWYLALTQDSARETGTVPSVRRGQTRGESDAAAPCACPLGGTVPASRKPRNKTPGRSARNDGPRSVADDRWDHCHRCVRLMRGIAGRATREANLQAIRRAMARATSGATRRGTGGVSRAAAVRQTRRATGGATDGLTVAATRPATGRTTGQFVEEVHRGFAM